jgi:hypothetical protein
VRWERRPEGQARPEELLKRFPARIQQLVERARATVRAAVPGAVEEVRPNRGYLGYRLGHQFAFIQPLQDHVRVGFAQGALLEDPAGLLLPEPGRVTRYVRLERPTDARRTELTDLLRRAAARPPERRPPRGRMQLARTRVARARPRGSAGR